MPDILSRVIQHFRRVLFVTRSVLVLLWLATCVCKLSAQEIANEPRRETWQRVPDLFRAMGVHEGAIVADVGAGEGFLTVRLSPLVGNSGKVYAVDSDNSLANGLRQRVLDAQMTNVEVITSTDDDPRLPRGLDAVIILNAYHEMKRGVTMLRHIHDALKPGAALMLCEPVPATVGRTRAAQMEDHALYPEIIVDDLQQAGFQIVDRQDTFATNLGGTNLTLRLQGQGAQVPVEIWGDQCSRSLRVRGCRDIYIVQRLRGVACRSGVCFFAHDSP
jgi:predicted methyltransferase